MADMALRENMKLVEINDQSYRVRKMPPWTATYLVKFVASKILPMISVLQLFETDNKQTNNVLADDAQQAQAEQEKKDTNREKMMQVFSSELPKILDQVTEEELKDLMIKCLQYIDAMYLPAGPQPLMSKHGSYGVKDIEYDFPLLLKGIIEVIKFNVSGFFGEGGFSMADLIGNTPRSKQ